MTEGSGAMVELRVLEAALREKAHIKDVERIAEKVDDLKESKADKKDVVYLKEEVDKKVSVESFTPVKLVVYGLVGIVLASVITAVVALVLI